MDSLTWDKSIRNAKFLNIIRYFSKHNKDFQFFWECLLHIVVLRVHVQEYQTYHGNLENFKCVHIFLLDRQ